MAQCKTKAKTRAKEMELRKRNGGCGERNRKSRQLSPTETQGRALRRAGSKEVERGRMT